MDKRYRDQKTVFLSKEKAEENRKWYLIDAEGLTLGRLATIIAGILTGKNKVDYSPSTDCGDGVILINTQKIYISGGKENKAYYSHNTRNLRVTTLHELRGKSNENSSSHRGNINHAILKAVWGMIPKTKSRKKNCLPRLRMFTGATHNMQAQEPLLLNIT